MTPKTACFLALFAVSACVAGCGTPAGPDAQTTPPDQATALADLEIASGDDGGDGGGLDGTDDTLPVAEDLARDDLAVPDLADASGSDLSTEPREFGPSDSSAPPDEASMLFPPDGAIISDLRFLADGQMIPDGGVADGPSGPPDFAGGGSVTYPVTVGMSNAPHFLPPQFIIKPGDTVLFNFATGGHTVTGGFNGQASGGWCSPSDNNCQGAPASQAGTSYQHTFKVAGTYNYFCRFHQNSSAQVIVKP